MTRFPECRKSAALFLRALSKSYGLLFFLIFSFETFKVSINHKETFLLPYERTKEMSVCRWQYHFRIDGFVRCIDWFFTFKASKLKNNYWFPLLPVDFIRLEWMEFVSAAVSSASLKLITFFSTWWDSLKDAVVGIKTEGTALKIAFL